MTEPAVNADAFNAFEAAGWERQAAGYDRFFGPITTRLIGPLLDAAGVKEGSRVLDVASGPGYVAAAAAGRGAAVVGVDVAETMVALARRLNSELEFRRGDAEALPFPDGSFDAAVANFVLLHLGRPERAAAELARVLAPGGGVALTVWDQPERARFVGAFLDAVAAAGAKPPDDIPAGPPFFRFADEDEFARLLCDAGLEEVRIQTVSFTHPESGPDALWNGFMDGTVRTAALILGQPEEMRRRIRAEFDRIVQAFEVDDGFALPVSVKLASVARSAAEHRAVEQGKGGARSDERARPGKPPRPPLGCRARSERRSSAAPSLAMTERPPHSSAETSRRRHAPDWGGDELFRRMRSRRPAVWDELDAWDEGERGAWSAAETRGTSARDEVDRELAALVAGRGPDAAEKPAPAEAGIAPSSEARPGRRTIRISGRPGEPSAPAARRRPPRRAHERLGPRPDRVAAWAVALGLLLVLIAVATADAAIAALLRVT